MLLVIFRAAIFTFFGKIQCPNEVPGKNNFYTFASILEVKTHFLTLPLFLSIFLAKMLKNVEIRCRLTEKLTEWNLNSIHNPMPGSPIFPKV